MSFEIKTAAELTDPELEARWVDQLIEALKRAGFRASPKSGPE